MTVPSNPGRNQYNGNGVTTVFAYTFRVLDEDHILVVLTDADDDDTTQVISTNYTVSGVGDSGGGSITMLVAPASGERLTIVRNVPLSQESDYTEGAAFAAETFEGDLDKSAMIDQQLNEALERTVRAPVSTTLTEAGLTLPAPVAGNVIGWNAAGDALENFDDTDSSTAAAAASAAAAAASAAAITDFRTVTSTGSSNAYVLTYSPAVTSLTDQAVYRFEASFANTATATANINGLGAKTIKRNFNNALISGDIASGQMVWLVYDAANDCFQMITPSNILESIVTIAVSDETTALTTGTNKATFVFPFDVTVLGVGASLNTVSSSGTPTFDINESGTTILSTKITIDANEKTSLTAATAPVISDSAITAGNEVGIDIDTAGTGAKGAKVWIRYRRVS